MDLEPPAAPLWLRACAFVVDAVLVCAGAACIGGVVLRRSLDGDDWEARMRRRTERLQRPSVTRALAFGESAASVTLHGRRSPGWRLTRIRRVDARTGLPETLRGTVTRRLLQGLLAEVLRQVTRPATQRIRQLAADAESQSAERRARLADDPEALEHDPEALERELDAVQSARARDCLTAMIGPLAIGSAHPLTALLSPRRQTLIERIAGVAVVRDRR